MHRRTAGNPFFVSQILAQPDSPLPESVRDAVLARIAGLAPSARQCLELLSCTPEAVGGELLGALGDDPDDGRRAGRHGLVERRGRGVAFRHEIARSAVLGATAPGAERALHAAMIEALEAVGGEPSVLAHHAAAAGDVDRDPAVRPGRRGRGVVAPGRTARRWPFYEIALQHVDGADPGRRATLLEALSTELYLTDRLADAIAAREAAVELRRELGDVVAVGAGHTAISRFAWYAADRAAAERHDRAAIAILTGADDRPGLGFALAEHVLPGGAARRRHRGRGCAGDARRGIADETGDDDVLRSTASVGVAVARPDGRRRRRPRRRCSPPATSACGTGWTILATTPMSNLCHLDVEQGRFADAEESVARRAADQRASATPRSAPPGSWGYGRGCGCCRAAGRRPSRTPARC